MEPKSPVNFITIFKFQSCLVGQLHGPIWLVPQPLTMQRCLREAYPSLNLKTFQDQYIPNQDTLVWFVAIVTGTDLFLVFDEITNSRRISMGG